MLYDARINNVDISTYGAKLIRGWFETLMKPYERKDFIVNESRLEDGMRITCGVNTKKGREIELQFLIEGTSEDNYYLKYKNFIEAINEYGIEIHIETSEVLKRPQIGTDGLRKVIYRTYSLVYLSCSKYGDYGHKKGIFVVRFIEPKPYKIDIIV